MEKETERISELGSSKWNWFGRKFPKREAVFFTQVIIIYIVIIACIINISIGNGNSNLWVALLSSCLGYLLPNPSMNNGPVLYHPA